MFGLLEEDEERKILFCFIDLEEQLPALMVGPIGVLYVGLAVEVIIVINFVVLLP